MKKVLMLGLALLAACAANALPTLNGPTGGFELPTANIAANGITVAVDQATNSDGIAIPNSRLLLGGDKTFEFGGMYEQVTQTNFFGSNDIEVWNANAKLQLLRCHGWKVAVGGVYGQLLDNNQGNLDHQWNAYVVATTKWGGCNTTANIGYGENIGAATKGYSGGVAAEKFLGERTAIGAEYLCGDKTGIFGNISPTLSHGNVYLTHAFTNNLSARVAVGGIGQDTSLNLGGSYKF